MNEQNEMPKTNQMNNNLTIYRECREGFNDDDTPTNKYSEINHVSYRNENLKYRKYQLCHKTCKLEIQIPIKNSGISSQQGRCRDGISMHRGIDNG